MDYVPGPFGPQELPEEIKQKLKTDLELQRMTAEQQSADFIQFIDSLDENGLRIVRSLMTLALADRDELFYMVGYLSSELQQRFDVCPYCNENHKIHEE